MSRPFECARACIRAYIAGSEVPEDPRHAENTLSWLLRLDPSAGEALRLAALAHDIDRASPNRVLRNAFSDYDAFKAAHAEHGALILHHMLTACELDRTTIDEACRLVRLHETGGDPDADRLREADSLSYFDVNLPLYFQREGEDETLRRCRWGVRRLSPQGRTLLASLPQPNATLARLVRRALSLEE